MLYKLLYQHADLFSPLNVFRYITFRTFISFFSSFLVCYLIGPYFINTLRKKHFGQSIRDDGPQTHKKKQGTPTMGGGLILLGVLASTILWTDLVNPFVWSVLVVTFGFGAVGYWDDWLKVSKKNSKGVKGKVRLSAEFAIAAVVMTYLVFRHDLSTVVAVPFFKEIGLDLNGFYIIFASLVIVGCANAVNLTDGLDGLAIFPVIVCAATLAIFSYVSGHAEIARYLAIPYIRGSGELCVLAGAVVAAGMGFLWFNTYPAQVFMGDVGSLSLGGFLGITAVISQNELLLVVLGGVFVVEALSVITQVISFKLTGRRIFKMAPIHHHYELKGLDETKIIVRFWIISILLAVLSLATLKLR